MYRLLLVIYHGLMVTWKAQFCGTLPPPVLELDAWLLGTTAISYRIIQTRGGRRRLGATAYSTPLTPMDVGMTDTNAIPPPQDAMVTKN